MRVYNYPSSAQARAGFAASPGGPHHGIMARAQYLERLGVVEVADRAQADLTHVTGTDRLPETDVQTINYIWPVALYPDAPPWWLEQNEQMALACQAARAVVVNSGYMVQEAWQLAGVHARLVPQAIDPEEWAGVQPDAWWRDWLGAENGRPIVLWGKNVVDNLRNPLPAVRLAKMRPDVLVVLTADAVQVEAMHGGRLPLNVRCVGKLAFEQMQRLLASADVYLATMLESSGQGHLEAMYLGKPVIGYRWGGVAELADGVAVLVEPGDITGLGRALDTALAERDERGAAGRRLVEDRHLWAGAAAMYKTIYEELLA